MRRTRRRWRMTIEQLHAAAAYVLEAAAESSASVSTEAYGELLRHAATLARAVEELLDETAAAASAEAARLTPSRAKLQELVRRFPPSPAWFEGDEPKPF
jgi:hypothetical protein